MSLVHIVDDPAAAAAERLIAVAEAGGSIVLAGGSTPKRAYALAANADWSKATVWFGDERCVRPDSQLSNYAMAKAALFDRLSAPPAAIHRIEAGSEPGPGAAAYDALLRDAPAFDLVLLGIGSDAHTASLFPGKPEIGEREKLAVAVPEAGLEPFVPRVSLTVPAFATAKEILFLAVGAEKASPVRRSFGRDVAEDTPAAIVAAAASGEVTVLCDLDAAAGL